MFLRSRVPVPALALSCVLLACIASPSGAATITIVPTVVDGDSTHGFEDMTPATPEGGNTGTTLGQQRRNVFNAAAAVWAAALGSNLEIKIAASFTALNCAPASGELGFAVPNSYQGLTVNGVSRLYPISLAEALYNNELNGTAPEIIARFNSRIDPNDAGCGGSVRLYYGLTGTPPAGTIALYPAVLHELAHGLGVESFFCTPDNIALYAGCAAGPGAYISGYPDSWSDYLYDTSTGKFFAEMTNAERATAWGNDPNIVWAGPKVTGHLPDFGQSGAVLSQGMMRIHAPATFDNALSLSHFTATTPDLLMEVIAGTYTVSTTDLTDCLLADLGWINNRCISRAPTLDAIANPATILEDAPQQTVNLAGIHDADNNTQTLSVAAVSGNTALIANPAVSYTSRNATGSLSYTPLANQSGSALVTVTLSDSGDTDGGGLNSFQRSFTVNVSPVNDAPTASNLSAGETYVEDTVLDLVDIVAADIDSPNITATLALTNPAFGALGTATSGAVTSTYNAGTGVWSAAGALADVNALLAGATFMPAPNVNAAFAINSQVTDGAASITGSKAFLGTAVNDAPTGTNLSAAESYTEDTPLNLVDIVASDIDSPNVTATLTMSNAAAGTLSTGTSGTVTSTYNAGTGLWSANGAIASVNTLLAGVVFTPATHFNGAFTLATSVSDGTAAVAGTKIFNGTAVNDAPTASNLSAAESYTEDTALNLVDIVAGDVDGGVLTATLTLSLPAAGSLSTGTSGAAASGFDAGTGTWSASGVAADVNVLLAGVVFTPAQDFNAGFAIATSVTDGIAAAVTGSKTVTGTAVNDAPTASNLSAPESFTEDVALDLVDIVATDIDSAVVTASLTLSQPAAGALNTATSGAVASAYNPGTGAWTASGAKADVNALLAGLVFTPAPNVANNISIATSVSDGVAAALTGNKPLTAIPVNDAPTATNLSAAESYTEDTPLNLVDIVASDIDSATLTATLVFSNASAGSLSTATSGAVTSAFDAGTGTWSASGAPANVNTLLAGVVFTPSTHAFAGFTLATSVSDGNASSSGSKAFSGIGVADAPTASNLSAPETYVEDTALDLVDIVVADPDGSALSVVLTLSDSAVGSLSTATSGAVTSSYNAGTGAWSASGAIADLNTLLAGLVFTPAADASGAFSLSTSVGDGTVAPVTGSKAFSGTAVDDAPTASNLSAPETYTEDTALDLVNIVASDIDSAVVTATLTLSSPAAGVLSTATAGAVTSTYAAATGAWSASGATADVNALLAGLVFQPAADFAGNFAIATQVAAGASSVSGNKLATAIAANDPPGATSPAAATLVEDTAVAFTGSEVFSSSDVDAAPLSVQLDATHGTLSVQAAAGVVFTTGDGSSDASMAFNGSVSAVNATLATLRYAPTADYHGSASIQWSVDDGVAAPVSPPATLVTVDPVADIVDDAIDAVQGQARSFNALTGSGGGAADSFENAGRVVVAVTQGAHGSASFAPDGTLTYTPAAGHPGSDQFTYTVSAGGAEESGNVLVTVGAINAAPTLDPIADPAPLANTAGPRTIPLTGIGAGAGESQALTLGAVSGNPALVANPTIDYTSPASTAQLHFTALPGATGTALITVSVQDSGGTANGGIDTVTRSFTVTIVPGAPLIFRAGFEGN